MFEDSFLENLFLVVLAVGAAVAVGVVVLASRGRFSRLNYIGFAIGFGIPGLLLFLAGSTLLRIVGFLMTAIAFGSVVAQFFYKPKHSDE